MRKAVIIMKKIYRALFILLTFSMTLLLFSCGGGDCKSHTDADKNAKCDACGADVTCQVCVDGDKDAKCDICGGIVACAECVDGDEDTKCDVCGAEMSSPVINDIVLIEKGIANFQFVLAKGIGADTRKMIDYTVIRGAERASGVVMTSVTEGFSNDVEQEIEVLVGDVKSRGEEYSMNRFDLGEKGYVIKMIGRKILINAGSDEAFAEAIMMFARDVLDYDNKDLENAVMTSEDTVINYQDDYKITSLAVNGADMRGYTIATDTADMNYLAAARSMRDGIYSKTGYYFEVVSADEAGEKSVIIKNIPRVYSDDSFKIYTEGSRLIIECAFDNKLADAVASFLTSTIVRGEGAVNFEGDVFKLDISFVTYEDFGAVGDGKADDFLAIKAAHDFANISGQTVKSEAGKRYRIHETREGGSGAVQYITIKTNVDWGGAEIIVDDTDITTKDGTKRSTKNVINVRSDYDDITITDETVLAGLAGIGVGTKKIDLKLGYPALLTVYNDAHEVYRRTGASRDGSGQSQHEIILIDAEGNVDESTPFMFDYVTVTRVIVHRVDVEPITVKNAVFTTLASRLNKLQVDENGETVYKVGYINRGINVSRPGTVVENIKHYVKGELTIEDQKNGIFGAAYNGFFYATGTNDVLFKDCVLTGRRCYEHSSYDFGARAVNKIRLEGCIQSNFYLKINDDGTTSPAFTLTYDENGAPIVTPESDALLSMGDNPAGGRICWGIGGTNFCKNMEYVNSVLSRFDAHCGLYGGKAVGTTINFFSLIGKGDFLIENCTWIAPDAGGANNSLIYLRGDYGSTWDGTITIKDTLAVAHRSTFGIVWHGFTNWYYGYTCYFPNIIIDNLEIQNIADGETVNFVYPKCAVISKDVHLEDYDGKNDNPIVPPEFIKIKNNSHGYKYYVPNSGIFKETDLSECEAGSAVREP